MESAGLVKMGYTAPQSKIHRRLANAVYHKMGETLPGVELSPIQ